MGGLSLIHWIIVLGIGLLLFGKRLPEVGARWGRVLSNSEKV